MKDSKLISLFSTFEKKEWRRFREFLESPYFNKRKDIVKLYQYIASLAPDFPEAKLNNAFVFKKIFPTQPYDDKQLKYVMNYLLKQAERFLIERKLESSTPLMNNFLLDALVNRKLDKHYKSRAEKISKELIFHQIESIDYYYYKYQLSDIANLHYTIQNIRKYDAHLQDVANGLDEFYFLNKLKYSCEMINRSKVLVDDYELKFIEEVVKYLEQEEEQAIPLIAIYLQIFYTLKKENAEAHFERLKEILSIYQEELPNKEKRTIYLYAINYCVAQISSSANQIYYVEECLKLYMVGIEQEFLFVNGYLSPWTFKNAVRLGLNLKRYDWTEQFIQKYYQKLAIEFQEDALHYNLADLAFRRKDYKTAQYQLLLVEFSDIFYSLGAKEMLLKIYYENQEIEALFALIASFSIYLRRNKKIAQNFRETYLNFTMLLQQVLRAKPQKIPKMIDKINNTPLLTNRSWLLEICEDLK